MLFLLLIRANALKTWSSLGISKLENVLKENGMKRPTLIQEMAIPRIIQGESVILHAETGSGKTLAYLCPLAICQRPTLVLAPSQLLCEQIRQVLAMISNPMNGTNLTDIFAGESCCIVLTPKEALRQLREINTTTNQAICFVLDEADALIKPLGKYATAAAKEYRRKPPGERVIEAITQIAPKAQLVAASATVGRPLRRRLAQLFPSVILLRPSSQHDHQRAISSPLAIAAHLVLAAEKPVAALAKALNALKPHRCLIAIQDEHDADNLVFFLSRRLSNSHVTNLARTTTRCVDSDTGSCLVVAPMRLLRGLDLPRLDLVILLGRPATADDYLHVSGRAGRAGHSGIALTIAPYEDLSKVFSTWSSQLGLNFQTTSIDSLEKIKY